MGKTFDKKFLYCETITAKIIEAMSDVIDKKVSDNAFLKAQDRVHAIILEEYIEVETPKVKK